ncbi:MAG: glycosyltransferase family 2 protein [Candidatus Kerfeldbacteria bacterium]|nr:glycosyltransferase family 2 protein [Candidatus Kerfeldbacteria bacterium]
MSKVSCVIPAYNEAESLPHLWAQLEPVLQAYPDWEAIVVSDGSTDSTVDVVRQLSQRQARLRLVEQGRNLGKSAALMAGFAAVTGDIIVTIDADLQDDPAEIPKLVDELERRPYDVVGGWKQHRRDPWIKVLSSKIFNRLANRALKTNFHDLNCGLKVFRRPVVDQLDLYGDLYRFIPLLAVADGWRVGEVPVAHRARQYGHSKYGLRLNGAFDLISILLLTKYRHRPLHFFGRWGGLLVLVGSGLLVYLAIIHWRGQAIGERPLLIFGVLFVLSGLQLFFTGLLGDLIVQRKR